MATRKSTATLLLAVATLAVVLVVGCGTDKQTTSPSQSSDTVTFNPPSTSFARDLGIADGPITGDQAKLIAAAAAGGTAQSVEQEDEDGVQVFGVAVQAPDGMKDVKVRISDGAVLKIESDDPGDEGGDSNSEND